MAIYVVHTKRHQGPVEYIGRPSPLGNPFVIDVHGDREIVIARYRHWLKTKIEEKDPRVCAEMNRLYRLAKEGDLHLGCWCAPRACHGDAIKELLEEAIARAS